VRQKSTRLPFRAGRPGLAPPMKYARAAGWIGILGLFVFTQQIFAAPSSEGEVSGTLTVDGKVILLEHAYLDVTDLDEPIVVLSDKRLPADAVPFIPEKRVKDEQVHAVAFSLSRSDGRLTNTFGKLYCPGHELGVGWGRVEEGNVALTVTRNDLAEIDGTVGTTKPVKLSFIAYSFSLTFHAKAGAAKK
jgi:hypothetical protein